MDLSPWLEIPFHFLKEITCSRLESFDNSINFRVPESIQGRPASAFEDHSTHSFLFSLPFFWCLFFEKSLKTMNFSHKPIFVSLLARKCASMHQVGLMATFRNIAKSENRVHDIWTYQSKIFQISAMITGFYWGTHRYLSSIRRVFLTNQNSGFYEASKMLPRKKTPCILYSGLNNKLW